MRAAEFGARRHGEPLLALTAAILLVLLSGGGLIFWIGLRPSVAYDPWGYIDLRTSPVARRAQHCASPLARRPTRCGSFRPRATRAPEGDGSLLQPMVRAHNMLVTAAGELSDEEEDANDNEPRTFTHVCRRRADSRCSTDSILTLANPAAVDSSGRLDGSSHMWIPSSVEGETLAMRSLVAPALTEAVATSRTPYRRRASAASSLAPAAFTSSLVVTFAKRISSVLQEGTTTLLRGKENSYASDDVADYDKSAGRLPMAPPTSAAADLLIGLEPPPPSADAPPREGDLVEVRACSSRVPTASASSANAALTQDVWAASTGELYLGKGGKRGRDTAGARWEAAARATLARQNEEGKMRGDGVRDKEGLGTCRQALENGNWRSRAAPAAVEVVEEVVARAAYDSPRTRSGRMDDVTWFIVQLVAGGLLWLCVVGGIASHHLLRLAPILRYTITHAANIILTSILASACGLGLIGWLSAMGWPSAQYTVGDSCDRSAGGLALRWNLGAHGGCIHAYALLTPLIVLPITLDAAFTLAHTLEYSWRAHAGDVAEERFAATLAIAMPRMLAAATAAAAAPLTAAFTSLPRQRRAYAAPAPVLQLAAAV